MARCTGSIRPGPFLVPTYWVAYPSLPAVQQIVLQDSQNIYALKSESSCGSGLFRVVKANSALNGWVDFSPFRCGFQLSVALDGTLSVTNLGGTVYLLPAGTSSWIGPFSSSNGPVTKMVVQDKNTAYALIGGTIFYFNVSAQTFTIMPSLSGTSGTDISVDSDGNIWFTGATNSSGNGNVYSASLVGANYQNKTPYRGFLTAVSAGLGNSHDGD